MVTFHLELNGELLGQAQDQGQAAHVQQPEQQPDTREADLSDPVFAGLVGALTLAAIAPTIVRTWRGRHQSHTQ